MPYTKYLEHLSEHDQNFLKIQENLLKETGEYNKTRYSIIILSLKKIINTHKDFGDLILFVSLLDSQNIPKYLLTHYKNDLIVDDFIFQLKKYSLITEESSIPSVGPVLSIHRSTQAIGLAYLIKMLNLKKDAILMPKITNILISCFEKIVNEEDTIKMKIIENHCNMILSHHSLLTGTVKGSLTGILGGIHASLGDFVRAEQHLKESLLSYSNAEKNNSVEIAWILGILGDVYSEIGRYEEAKNIFEKSIMLYKKRFSDNHNQIIRTSSNLGYVYKELGNYAKAQELLEENLLAYRKYFPDDYLGIAWTLLFLGYLHQDIGNYEKAKNYFEESFLAYQNHLPKNHIIAAWILTHLGNVYLKLGDTEKSRNLVEQALKICKIHYSNDHVGLAVILGHLGEIHKEISNYKEAKVLFEQSLIIFKKHYVKNHTRISLALRQLSNISFLESQLEATEAFLNEALSGSQMNKQPYVYMLLEDYAELYLKKSQMTHDNNLEQSDTFQKKAINCLEQALEVVKIYFPEISPHKTRIQNKLKSLEQCHGKRGKIKGKHPPSSVKKCEKARFCAPI